MARLVAPPRGKGNLRQSDAIGALGPFFSIPGVARFASRRDRIDALHRRLSATIESHGDIEEE